MNITKLIKAGDSMMLEIPPQIVQTLNLQEGNYIELFVENNQLIIKTQQRFKYTLEDLISQCDPNADDSFEDKSWLNLKSVGNELL